MAEEVPTRRLLFVRHGHYERAPEGDDTTWGLTASGRKQAAKLARRLARTLPGIPGRFEGVYSSPWPRALETAQIVARDLEIEKVRVKPYLHEITPLVPADDKGKSVHPGLSVTSDEAREAAVAQIDRILARFFQPSKRTTTYIVVCHGNLIRYLVAHVMGLPFEAWMRLDSHHTGLTELRIFPGRQMAVVAYNDTGHLPPAMVST